MDVFYRTFFEKKSKIKFYTCLLLLLFLVIEEALIVFASNSRAATGENG